MMKIFFPLPTGQNAPEWVKRGVVWPVIKNGNPLNVETWESHERGIGQWNDWEILHFPRTGKKQVIRKLTLQEVREKGYRPGSMVICAPGPKDEYGEETVAHFPYRLMFPNKTKERPVFENAEQDQPGEYGEYLPSWYGLDPGSILLSMAAPLFTGSRGIMFAEPEAGKSTMAQLLARSMRLARNAGKLNHLGGPMLIVHLGIDERPEERKSVGGTEWYDIRFTIPYTLSDEDKLEFAIMARQIILRLAECGVHIFLVIDSLTRMARVMNNVMPEMLRVQSAGQAVQGSTGSGGLDSKALSKFRSWIGLCGLPEKEEGQPTMGSITSISTVLVGSQDTFEQRIAKESRGLGNWSAFLSYALGSKSMWPAIELFADADPRARSESKKTTQRVGEHGLSRVLGCSVDEASAVLSVFNAWVGQDPMKAHPKLMELAYGIAHMENPDPMDVFRKFAKGCDSSAPQKGISVLDSMRRTKHGKESEHAMDDLRDGASICLTRLIAGDSADKAIGVMKGKIADDLPKGYMLAKVKVGSGDNEQTITHLHHLVKRIIDKHKDAGDFADELKRILENVEAVAKEQAETKEKKQRRHKGNQRNGGNNNRKREGNRQHA